MKKPMTEIRILRKKSRYRIIKAVTIHNKLDFFFFPGIHNLTKIKDIRNFALNLRDALTKPILREKDFAEYKEINNDK